MAVNNLSFEVRRGEILGIIGPNGSGKTTVFNLLTGILQADNGSIILDGKDITHLSAARRCKTGIGRTYQIPRPFTKMTVLENLMVPAVHGGGLSEKEAVRVSDEILELISMTQVRNNFASTLSLLDRKRLELGRALATQPSIILIDEVAGGLTEKEVEQLLRIVKTIQRQGITIIWIEHIIMFAIGYVLQRFLFNRVLGKEMKPPLLIAFGVSIILYNLMLTALTPDARSLMSDLSIMTAGVAGVLVGMTFTFYPHSGPQYLIISFGVIVICGL
jgi:branched-chain amino acid transport system ATP-binding protein